MALTRRQFLTLLGGSAASAVVFQACGVPERELLFESPNQMPEDLVTGFETWYATLCRQCPNHEGIVVRIISGRAKKIEGNVDYPINTGKHSARCEAGLQALYHPDRISSPLVRTGPRGSGRFQEISWDDAISRLTLQLQNLQGANNQAAFVMATNPLGAHMELVADRFVSAFGGRRLAFEPLETVNLRAAIRQVFGQELMPTFDIRNSGFVLSFGADWLGSWVSPVQFAREYGFFRQGDRPRGRMVHVEPRLSMTATNADKWVYVRPGMEGILALSIAQVIISEGRGDAAAAAALTGSGAVNLDSFAPETVAERVGVSADRIQEIAHQFADMRPSIAIGGGSAGAHTNGLFNLIAIYSLNHLVGSVGQQGGVIFNPRPPLEDIPAVPATTPFVQWQQLVQQMRQGQVQAMLLRKANPWYALPDVLGFKDAMFDVPFIFSVSEIMDDTTRMADLIMPEHNYLESWGSDVPNPGPGYQVMGFQQPVVRPFFEARGVHLGTRAFPDILLAAAQGLNLDLGLPGETFKDILQDSAARLWELGRGSVQAPTAQLFWHGVLQRGGWWDPSARFIDPVPPPPQLPPAQEPAFDSTDTGRFPFHLAPFVSTNLSDGSLAHLPWLQAAPDPTSTAVWRTWVEINRRLADERGIVEGDVIRITSPYGSIEALAWPNPATPPDVVGVPVGQGHTGDGRFADGRGSNVYSILAPQADAQTGALAWASTRVNIEKTDQWVRLPKFENRVPFDPRDEEQLVLKVTSHDT